MKCVRRYLGVIGAVGLAFVMGSVSVEALPIGIEGVRVDTSNTVQSIDNWLFTVKKQGEHFRIVPSLAGDATSHEGFITMRGVGIISGKGKSSVLGAAVDVGYMVGCGVDVSDGVTVGSSYSVSITPSVGASDEEGVSNQTTVHGSATPSASATANGSVTPSVQLGFPTQVGGSATAGISGTGGASVTAGASDTVGVHLNTGHHVDLSGTASKTSHYSAHIKPGYVTNVWIANAKLRKTMGGVVLGGIPIAVTGCGTLVKVRSVVRFTVETEMGNAVVYTYGSPFRI